jgi:excisionase family DNA binding protein
MTRFITTKQLAQMLGVSERHLYRQHAAGKLPRPVRIGRCVRWDPEEFREWLNNKNNQQPRGRR